jgi:hypothetical protein
VRGVHGGVSPRRLSLSALSVACGVLVLVLPVAPATASTAIAQVSRGCTGQNAEVVQAVDPGTARLYEAWMGCGGIGFARSRDGGRLFSAPILVPGSRGQTWDPHVAVAPNGTVYVAFMVSDRGYTYPVVATSFDRGLTFPQVSRLRPPIKGNWGDRPFLTVAPNGDVYITWDYGPSAAAVTYICPPSGSCAFATGDLNVVFQRSTDGGRTWGRITPISPGFPASGADSAPLVVEPDGRIDVEYQGYRVTNPVTYTLAPAHTYFTSSVDGGTTWSAPLRIGPADLTMAKAEWWIDGSIGLDAAGDLYLTWDTQGKTTGDVGWLAWSSDHGRTWSPLRRVTPDRDHAVHIVEVVGAGPGTAYVAWQTDAPPRGYATYLRAFSITEGWLGPPVRVSDRYGNRAVWPGDTFGLSTLPDNRVALSWGSANGAGKTSEIYASVVQGASPGP